MLRPLNRCSSVTAAIVLCVIGHAWLCPPAAAVATVQNTASRATTNPLEGKPDAIQNGGAMFRTRCAGCHGPDARGSLGPDLTGLRAPGSADARNLELAWTG